MQVKAKERKGNAARIACVLLVLAFVLACLLVGLSARFVSEGETEDGARTAAFAFTMQNEESASFKLDGIKKPGDTETYPFTVSNTRDGAVSEVALNYWFTVQINGSMPLECKIVKADEGAANPSNPAGASDSSGSENGSDAVLLVSLDETDSNADNADGGVKKEEKAGEFDAASQCTDKYNLIVRWPEDKNDAKYASRSAVAEVTLSVKAEQID